MHLKKYYSQCEHNYTHYRHRLMQRNCSAGVPTQIKAVLVWFHFYRKTLCNQMNVCCKCHLWKHCQRATIMKKGPEQRNWPMVDVSTNLHNNVYYVLGMLLNSFSCQWYWMLLRHCLSQLVSNTDRWLSPAIYSYLRVLSLHYISSMLIVQSTIIYSITRVPYQWDRFKGEKMT